LQDGRPLPVPYSFWLGGSKLAWPADDKATIYRAFPTLYLAFATSGNASEEFSLAITPQVGSAHSLCNAHIGWAVLTLCNAHPGWAVLTLCVMHTPGWAVLTLCVMHTPGGQCSLSV